MKVLTELQELILSCVPDLPDKEAFYLTGGTALSAFYLKHRRSNDIDLFTGIEELISPYSLNLEESLKEVGLEVEKTRGFKSFVELYVRSQTDSTAIHIARDSLFRFEAPVESSEFPGLNVDSLTDIATNKILTLFGRAMLRDFLDVYFLLKQKFGKSEILQKAGQKDPGFDLYWFAMAMERVEEFTDDSPEMHLLIIPCNMHELKDFFGNWRREIAKGIIGDKSKDY